jgi:hypothetical protein
VDYVDCFVFCCGESFRRAVDRSIGDDDEFDRLAEPPVTRRRISSTFSDDRASLVVYRNDNSKS